MKRLSKEPDRRAWSALDVAALGPAEPEGANDEARARYRELVAEAELADGEVAELGALARQLGRQPGEVELDGVILREAARLEIVIAGEPAALDEERESFPAAARQGERVNIMRHGSFGPPPQISRDDAAAQRHNAARRQCQAIVAARAELGAMHSRWPALFGLLETRMSNSWHQSALPVRVQDAARRLGVTISI